MVTTAEKINSRIFTEVQLLDRKLGFTAAFLGLQHLETHISAGPGIITRETVDAVLHQLRSNRFEHKKQSYFLYQLASSALITICKQPEHAFTVFLIVELQKIVVTSTGNKQRAVSEALGSLPINLKGPDMESFQSDHILDVSFSKLLIKFQCKAFKTFEWVGRTLVIHLNKKKNLCIKFLKQNQDPLELSQEASWLSYLSQNTQIRIDSRQFPEPVLISKKSLFHISDIPADIQFPDGVSTTRAAIAYLAVPEYFHYLNEPEVLDHQDNSFPACFRKNAYQLGELMSNGIIHTALIPLFHNRVQQTRRQDQGRYLWEHGGRLDQWLHSCRYPNFAKSGLRDFEHLLSVSDSSQARHFIGEHLLSFILVLGSYFRNLKPQKIGLDQAGFPYDCRYQFDSLIFKNTLETIFNDYYKGVTGCSVKQLKAFVSHELIQQLIDAMGIDNHMEETLRIHDQNQMTREEFETFLKDKGMSQTCIQELIPGEQDIVLQTGPHLGGFNQTIGIPALIELLFCLSSLCVSDRYLMENGLKASAN